MSTVSVSQQPSRELINKEGGWMKNSALLTAAALIALVLLDVMMGML